eukprot:m.67038 g.67038  ORF g.67038 m.67038 type:complete len:347 (+) comp13800_c0_seq3:396-1436(+)
MFKKSGKDKSGSSSSSARSSRRSSLKTTPPKQKLPEPDPPADDEDTLQHISEREDHAEHEIALLHNVLPSSAAASPTMKRMSPRRTEPPTSLTGEAVAEVPMRKRSNSTSTLYVDATVSSPDLDETLRCVAAAYRYIIIDGHRQASPNLYAHKFDEHTFPLTEGRVAADYATRIPSEDEIHQFMKGLFHAAALTAECAIIALVYVNRTIAYTQLSLHASNWKRVVLGAILMASKVWDDQAVWNVDFCSILPRISVEDMNDLERTYLEMLQFNINVDSSVYAKYYFELRSLAEKTNHTFHLQPLDKERAAKLEAMSEGYGRSLKAEMQVRNAKSLDGKTFSSRAVLS